MVIIEKIKQHPWLAAMLLGAILILLFVISRRSSGGAVNASSGVDPTTASLYAQNQQLTAQASMQANQLDAQLQHDQITSDYGLALAKIQNDAGTQQLNTQASVALAKITADSDVQRQGIAATLQGLGYQSAVQMAGIEAQLRGLESNNATTVNIAQIMAQEQLGIANLTAQTQLGLSNNMTQADIARTNAGVTTAGINAGAAKHASDNQLIGSIASGIFSMFSDDRVKENVVYVGRRKGFQIFEFNYFGDTARYRGVMAQEVRAKRPDAVNDNGGILTVDYAKLGLRMERVA